MQYVADLVEQIHHMKNRKKEYSNLRYSYVGFLLWRHFSQQKKSNAVNYICIMQFGQMGIY
jgi:hypothetical protein